MSKKKKCAHGFVNSMHLLMVSQSPMCSVRKHNVPRKLGSPKTPEALVELSVSISWISFGGARSWS